MWYDFNSGFTFKGHKSIVTVEFSHFSGEFVVSVLSNESEKLSLRTKNENEAIELFTIIVEYLQSNQEVEMQKLYSYFNKQEG